MATKHITMVFALNELSDRELDSLSERATCVDFSNLKSDLQITTRKLHIFQEGLQRVVSQADYSTHQLALNYLREGLNYGIED